MNYIGTSKIDPKTKKRIINKIIKRLLLDLAESPQHSPRVITSAV